MNKQGRALAAMPENWSRAPPRFPIQPGTELTLWLRDPRGVLDAQIFRPLYTPTQGGFINCRVVDAINSFEPGRVRLKIGVAEFWIKITRDGRCYLTARA